MAHRSRPSCRYAARHWFTYYGEPGTSSPTCRRCGEANPNYRPQDDPRREARERERL